jgi:hypothetical protein
MERLQTKLSMELPSEMVFEIMEYLPMARREKVLRWQWRNRKVFELVMEWGYIPVRQQVQICLCRWLTYTSVINWPQGPTCMSAPDCRLRRIERFYIFTPRWPAGDIEPFRIRHIRRSKDACEYLSTHAGKQ